MLATDERVLDLMTLYDGAREALPIDYRVHMMHAMERYPMGHREIPKKVFAKITKLYPTEPQETRTVLMAVVLELIHTDAMREKLFQFIRNQFESEKPDTQTVTCRVNRRLCEKILRSVCLPCWKRNSAAPRIPCFRCLIIRILFAAELLRYRC